MSEVDIDTRIRSLRSRIAWRPRRRGNHNQVVLAQIYQVLIRIGQQTPELSAGVEKCASAITDIGSDMTLQYENETRLMKRQLASLERKAKKRK